MKVSTVMKPAMLFAAGSTASVASAAVTIDTTVYNATPTGTAITIAGASSNQYTFSSGQKVTEGGPSNNYVVYANNGATITNGSFSSSDQALNADGNFGPKAVTGQTGTPTAALLVNSDAYYGLRFQSGATSYRGFAGVINGGATINQIGYEAIGGAVPEPATWAMMIAGLGGAGVAMRRRRRQASAAALVA